MAATVAAQLAALVEIVNQLKERTEEDRADLKAYHEKLSLALTADRQASDTYRATMHEDLAKLTEGQRTILKRVEAVEPVIEMVTSFRAKMTGAFLLLGVLGSTVIWMLVYFRDLITKAWIP